MCMHGNTVCYSHSNLKINSVHFITARAVRTWCGCVYTYFATKSAQADGQLIFGVRVVLDGGSTKMRGWDLDLENEVKM